MYSPTTGLDVIATGSSTRRFIVAPQRRGSTLPRPGGPPAIIHLPRGRPGGAIGIPTWALQEVCQSLRGRGHALTQGVLLKSPMPQREGGSSLFKRETEQLCSKQPRRRIGGGKVCQPRCDGDTKRAQMISEETPTSPGFTVAGHQLAMRVAKERASPLCRPIVRVSSAG